MAAPHTSIKPGLVRCHETTTTTGTGTLNLDGANSNHVSFVTAVGTTNTCEFIIQHQSAAEWERSIGVVTDATPDTLSRVTVLDGSGGVGTAVSFAAGTKDVFITPNSTVQPVVTTVAPAVTDDNDGTNGVFLPGQLWVDTTNDRCYVLIDDTNGAAKWHEITTGFNASSELTVASGAVTVTGAGLYRIDTQADAATDPLDTISGGTDGMIIAIVAENAARDVMLTDNGNIQYPHDDMNQRVLSTSPMLMVYHGSVSKWQIVAAGPGQPRALMIDHNFSESDEELTIATGAVTLSGGVHTIDTESDAATDDLDTINGAFKGMFLLLKAANSAREVVLTDAGNIRAAVGTPILGTEHYTMMYYDGTNWLIVGNRPAGYRAAADSATVTFDLDESRLWEVTLGGNRTLALANEAAADTQPFMIALEQDATGSRTVTWFAGIEWSGGTVPTLTTTASKTDVFVFVRRGSADFMGFELGLNYSA